MPFALFPSFMKRGASAPTGLRNPSVIGRGNRGGGSTPRPAGGTVNKTSGRLGVQPHAATNAGSDVQVFQNYSFTTLGQSQTFPLPADGDFVAAIFSVAVTAASTSVSTTDILSYFAANGIEIVAQDGPIIDLTPVRAFYDFQQRFGEYGVAPTVTPLATSTVTVSASATYYVSGLNLPQSSGPYTLNITIAGSNPSSGALVSVVVSLFLVIGSTPNGLRTRFKENSLPFTPAANGTQDLAPVAAIQGVELQELFFDGLTSNTADIAFLQIASAGTTLGTRVSSADVVARDTAKMSGTIAATRLYPLFAFNTALVLDRTAHFYITWGASPSSTIVVGYYWLE